MTASDVSVHEQEPDPHHDPYSKTVFGFWVYLMTDFMLFATLFAAYDVLHNRTFGGPSAADLFHLPSVLLKTALLLLSSLTAGLGGVTAHRRLRGPTITFFGITFLLGIAFLWLQFSEFATLISAGNDWSRSAFLSIYFTILGTHTIHIVIALLWFFVLFPPIFLHGISSGSVRRLACLRMFWQFLNVVWIFIFTVIYLMGVAL